MIATMPPTSRPSPSNTIFIGTFIHCTSQTNIEILLNKAVGVDEAGIIRFLWDAGVSLANDRIKAGSGWSTWKVVRAGHGGFDFGFFFPGFVGKMHQRAPRHDRLY